MRTETNFAAAALRSLVVDRLAHKDTAGAGAYGAQLLALPEATLGDRLRQLGILQQLPGDGFDPLLQAVQAAAATNAPAAAQVAAWMQANGLLAGSLQWLTNLPAEIRAQTPVRIVLADGYTQGGDWRTLRDFTSQGNWGEVEYLRLALLAHAWSQLDVRAVADGSWGSAVTEAGNRYETLTTLLKLAEKWKLPDKREDLLERIVKRFPQEGWAQQALAESYFASGKTAELNQLYARLFAQFPKNPAYENNLAATALLLKTNLAQAGRWAQEVYAGNTNDAAYAATYAFALYRQGRTTDGLAVLRKVDKTLQERPDVALYYGCLLAATGATNEAAPYLEIAGSHDRLLPEEQRLLAEATGR
jgi:thioredoxin-like negative regulator of GroEL